MNCDTIYMFTEPPNDTYETCIVVYKTLAQEIVRHITTHNATACCFCVD